MFEINWTMVVKAFIIGGILCVIAQVFIDKTKFTPARILVAYVTIGCILGGLGIYKPLIDFAGCGATVPLTGFGNLLATGAIDGVKENGFLGAFSGGTVAAAGRNRSSSIFWIYCIISFKAKNKETIKLDITNRNANKLIFCL